MKWLLPLRESNHAQVRLVCFPFAGGGVDTFRQWPHLMDSEIDILSVLLPGRGLNFGAELVRECDVVTREVCKAILSKRAKTTLFFGHSLGSLIAYNTALKMTQYSSEIRPIALILSGCNPLSVVTDDDNDVRWTTDDEALVKKISDLGGLPSEVVENEQLLKLVKPVLRSDLFLADNARRLALARYRGLMPNIPIIAMGGDQDPKVDTTGLDLWSQYTRASFSKKIFSGGHFFIVDEIADVCRFVNESVNLLTNDRRFSTNS